MSRILALLGLLLPLAAQAQPIPSSGTSNNSTQRIPPYTLTANTTHNEITATDGVVSAASTSFSSASAAFTQGDRGKTIVLNGLGVAEADLVTTIASVQSGTAITLNTVTTYAGPWFTVGRANVATAQSGAGSYAIGDTLTVSGGTSVTTAGVFTIVSVGVGSATVNAAGAGGTGNATCTVVGTTGVTRPTSVVNVNSPLTSYFTANVTLTAGGAISTINSITTPGSYSTPPTSLAAEPVVNSSGCGSLTGATLVLKMGPFNVQQTTAGHYGALPANPVATTTSGSGTGATLTLQDTGKVGGYYAYGTDDSTVINNTIAAVSTAGGGTVQFPCGQSLMLSAFSIPFTGASNPTQYPIRMTGCNASIDGYIDNNGAIAVPKGGTVIDNQFSGDAGTHVAKIDTRGGGTLELDHITFLDNGTSNFLFLQTTNTTLLAHYLRWVGNPTCWRSTCKQDVIRLGAIASGAIPLGSVLAVAGFQGYGTEVTNNQFAHTREVIQFGASSNGVQTFNNTISASNGSNLTNGAPYHFYGAGLGSQANVLNGIVEMSGYNYGVLMDHVTSTNNYNQINLGFYDEVPGNPSIGAVNMDASSTSNFINTTYISPVLDTLIATGAGGISATVIDSSGKGTQFPNNLVFGQGTGVPKVFIQGGNTASGDGPSLWLQGGNARPVTLNTETVGIIGTYSAINGGAYTKNLTIYGRGNNILIPFDSVGIKTGSTVPFGTLAVGPGTGKVFMALNGGVTNAADGAYYAVYNNGGVALGAFGNVDAIIGGAYSNTMGIWASGNGVWFPSDGLIVGAPTGGHAGGGTINIATKYDVNGTQVVAGRVTGWTAATNGSRAGLNGSTATLAQTSAALAQVIIDLTTHGLIGP